MGGNIFNSDQTPQGYADGIQDAESNKSKDYSRVTKHPKTWVFGQAAMDSYASGYDKGHGDGLAKQHGVYQPSSTPNPTPSGGSTMQGSGNNIHATIQPDAVEQFVTDLRLFQREAAQLTSNLHDAVRSLEDGRWNDPNYHEFLSRVMRVVQQMEHIDDNLIAQQMVPQLERLITAARNAKV